MYLSVYAILNHIGIMVVLNEMGYVSYLLVLVINIYILRLIDSIDQKLLFFKLRLTSNPEPSGEDKK